MVVIPWRGFRCFTLGESGAGLYSQRCVVIPWRGLRWFTRKTLRPTGRLWPYRCNPLAGIEVFHTGGTSASECAHLATVVIPWRGLRCFTLRLRTCSSSPRWRSCNPLAGIEVFHTKEASASLTTVQSSGCNPLAGIEVFHTAERRVAPGSPNDAVVIPWRGLRCFTRGSSPRITKTPR